MISRLIAERKVVLSLQPFQNENVKFEFLLTCPFSVGRQLGTYWFDFDFYISEKLWGGNWKGGVISVRDENSENCFLLGRNGMGLLIFYGDGKCDMDTWGKWDISGFSFPVFWYFQVERGIQRTYPTLQFNPPPLKTHHISQIFHPRHTIMNTPPTPESRHKTANGTWDGNGGSGAQDLLFKVWSRRGINESNSTKVLQICKNPSFLSHTKSPLTRGVDCSVTECLRPAGSV